MSKPVELAKPRIILTINQARALQSLGLDAWPGHWAALLDVPVPLYPDKTVDPVRSDAAFAMMRWGCEPDQIVEQLHIGEKGTTMKMARRRMDAEERRRVE